MLRFGFMTRRLTLRIIAEKRNKYLNENKKEREKKLDKICSKDKYRCTFIFEKL